MKTYRIAILTAILILIFTSVAMAATDQDTQFAWNFIKIMVCGLAIAVLGISASRKGDIILFANYTDITYTAGVIFIPLLIGILLAIMIGDKINDGRYILYFSLAIAAVLFLVVLKSTYMYNKDYKYGIRAFILASISKIFMLCLFIIALIFALCTAGNRKQRWYESDSDHQLKSLARSAAGVAAASGVFLFLSRLGLSKPGFVSFNEYINGRQKAEGQLHVGGGF